VCPCRSRQPIAAACGHFDAVAFRNLLSTILLTLLDSLPRQSTFIFNLHTRFAASRPIAETRTCVIRRSLVVKESVSSPWKQCPAGLFPPSRPALLVVRVGREHRRGSHRVKPPPRFLFAHPLAGPVFHHILHELSAPSYSPIRSKAE